MSTKAKGWAFWVTTIVALTLFLVSGVLWASNQASSDEAPASTVTGEDLLQNLTVGPEDVLPPEALCASNEFLRNSLASPSLAWSDSVSTPFDDESSEEAILQELRQELCGNPTELLMTVQGLSAIVVEDNVTISDVNPWMAEFVELAKADMFSLLFKTSEDGDSIFVTPEFQTVAEMTNTVLLRLKSSGVVSATTLSNWHVDGRSGLAAGEIPVATPNPGRYTGEFIRLEYTAKGAECPIFTVGFNIGDKRFAELPGRCEPAPETGEPEPQPGPTTPAGETPTVPPTVPPTTTPTTPPTEVCPPDKPYGTWPNCKDSPTRDPAAQGNAPQGGGQNVDPGPGEYVAPGQMEQPPATPRVNPTTPAATPAPAAPPVVVQPPVVVPEEQPTNNGVVPTEAPSGAVCNPDFQDC